MATATKTAPEPTGNVTAQGNQNPFNDGDHEKRLVNGTKVWVRILAGPNSPEALSPGVITDQRIMDREVVRSQTKGGRMTLPNTMVVVSYRTPPGRTPFYAERPEQVIGIFPREEHLPVIDGPESRDWFNEVLPALRSRAERDFGNRIPAPTDTAIKEAASAYENAPSIL
jgi:hypothetical protein